MVDFNDRRNNDPPEDLPSLAIAKEVAKTITGRQIKDVEKGNYDSVGHLTGRELSAFMKHYKRGDRLY